MTQIADPRTMERLARIWADILGVKAVGPDDNFFALGGHSLMAVKLISAVQDEMELGGELKLSDVLEYPTPRAFADHLLALDESEEWGEI